MLFVEFYIYSQSKYSRNPQTYTDIFFFWKMTNEGLPEMHYISACNDYRCVYHWLRFKTKCGESSASFSDHCWIKTHMAIFANLLKMYSETCLQFPREIEKSVSDISVAFLGHWLWRHGYKHEQVLWVSAPSEEVSWVLPANVCGRCKLRVCMPSSTAGLAHCYWKTFSIWLPNPSWTVAKLSVYFKQQVGRPPVHSHPTADITLCFWETA